MDKNSYLKQFHKFQQNREKHFAPKIYAALRHQYQQFLTHYKHTKNEHSSLMAITATSITEALKKLYLDAGVHYGSLVYSQLPKAPKKVKHLFDVRNFPSGPELLKRRAPIGFNQEMVDLINQYFEEEILNTSQGITDTTRDLIRVIMQIANEEGRSLEWIVNELETESVDLTRNRSRLIARTETVTAANQAGYFAAAKTGLLMKKEWLSASDNRVRPDHAAVNGSKVDMEDYFTVGDSKMLLPGARVQENGLEVPAKEVCNCRCTVLYEPQRVNGRLVEFNYQLN